MKFRHTIVALAAVSLGAFGCASNPPAQQPTTTGATQGYNENGTNQPGQDQNGVGVQGNIGGGVNAGENGVGAEGNAGGSAHAGGSGVQGSMQGNANIGGTEQGSQAQGQMGQGQFTTDGQIAAFADAVNKAEVDQAKLALRKAKDAQVKAFAQEMANQHGQLLNTEKRMLSAQNITPEPNATVNQLESQAQSGLSTLSSKTGNDFDKAYIDLQVQEHQQVLNSLDNDILPAARNATFKQELQTMRNHVQMHLQRAQAIQQRLQGGGTSNP